MAPANDAYSLRLVATRRMYDNGTMVQACPASAGLAAAVQVRLNPADFDKLGVEPGAIVKVLSGKGELMAPVAIDVGVPVGSAAIPPTRQMRQRQPADRRDDVGDRRASGARMILGQDPLYAGDIWDALPVTLLKAVAAFVFLLVSVMLNIWFLRKVISDFQNRIGPTSLVRGASFRPSPTASSSSSRKTSIPDNADRFTFKLAPYLSLVPAFLTFAIVPVGGDFNGDGSRDGLVTILGEAHVLPGC